MKTKKGLTKTNPRLSVRDADGVLRKTFARIGARIETGGGLTAGVRYAAALADGETRREFQPLDWAACALDELRTLGVHGDDYRVRAAALAEIEKRLALPYCFGVRDGQVED